jgi:hypothetical protein
MTVGTRFAIATREEVWSQGRLVERRLSHGEAVETSDGIAAIDARDDALVDACDREMARLRGCVVSDARVRLIAEATLESVTATIIVTLGEHSVVTTPEHIAADVALLRGIAGRRFPADRSDRPDLPMLWKNGSAAVLLHEAVGHPMEHEHPPLALPSWLSIDLPLAMRRASFRDLPLLRMTTLVARQSGAPFALPAERIEVLLVDGGSYEPLTESVTLRIGAVDLVRGKSKGDIRRPLAPFTLVEKRAALIGSIRGASGEPLRYPGVVCSREGQELVVGSFAPLMVTEMVTGMVTG